MSGGVCDKKKTNQSTVTLQSRTSSTWGWCMVTQALNTTFPTCAALGSHEAADLLYCHWCITEQSCEGFWVIRFPSPPQPCLNPINCLLYLSKQKTQRQRKIELWDCLSSHPPVSIQSVVHTVIKKRNNNNPRYSHEHVNIFAPVFLMLLYVLQNLYPYL